VRASSHSIDSLDETERSPSEAATGAARLQAIFVLNSLNVGGSETKVVRLANALQRRKLRVGIAYLNEPSALRPAIDKGIPVWPLGRRGKFSFKAVRALRAVLLSTRAPLVFAVNLYPVLYVVTAAALLPSRPVTAALFNTTAPTVRERWRRVCFVPFLARLDRVVFGCDVQRKQWRPRLRSVRERAVVIYNGVDVAHFAPAGESVRAAERSRRGFASGTFVFGTVGRLAPEKNQQALIAALAQLRKQGIDAHLVIVGEGSERGALEQAAAQHGVAEHVTFAGVQYDVRPWLAVLDVFVLPSRNIETFSNAALEAMAMAKPAILSRIGGADEMIRDGVEGYVLDLDDLERELPKRLQLLQADPALREQLGRQARARVEERFSLSAMVDAFAGLITATKKA